MEDEKILDGFPVITEEDVRRINTIFKPYVFYTTTRNGGRDCECSACNRRFHMARLVRTETPERSRFMMARHNWKAACPMCGQTVTLKNKGTCKSGANLEEWIRVVLLHARDGEIYAQAGYVRKRYAPDANVWWGYSRFNGTFNDWRFAAVGGVTGGKSLAPSQS